MCTLHNCIVIVKAPPQFRQYEIDSSNFDEEPIKFRYCDTMGIESTRGLTASDFGKIMDGHIEDTAEVKWTNPLKLNLRVFFLPARSKRPFGSGNSRLQVQTHRG